MTNKQKLDRDIREWCLITTGFYSSNPVILEELIREGNRNVSLAYQRLKYGITDTELILENIKNKAKELGYK